MVYPIQEVTPGRGTAGTWAIFTYEKKWSLKLLDSGVGGLEELTKNLNKNLIQYGLCRVTDPNSGVERIILIHWVGENVDAFRRGVAAEHLPSIRRFFKEANVVLGAQKVEDITQEAVAQALSRAPPPTRSFQKPRPPGSLEVVGTKYMKTNPAAEMKISRREAFWQRSEREEERRKEAERLRLQEERINLEKERIHRERLEEEERERRIQEKERMVEEQRREQARLDAERRRLEKERWAQQQKEYEEEMKGRFRRSQSIEMAAEAAALVSGRSLHPRDFFRQQERSVSTSFSPPSTPSSPSKSSSGFFNRTTPRYQRSMTESILTPTSRSPTFFQGFQKRDSFRSVSPSTPQPCSPAFIFSKSPLPGISPKVDSLPPFIPPPITATRVTTTQVKGSPSPPHPHHTSPKTPSYDVPFRAEYVTVSPAESSAASPNINAPARTQHETLQGMESPAQSSGVYRAELVAVDSPSSSHSEAHELPNKTAKSPTAIKATVSVSSPVREIALTSPAPMPEAKTLPTPQWTDSAVSIPSLTLGGTQPTIASAAPVTPPAQISLSSALPTYKTSNINETVLATDSTLSYEPKVSPAATSLVSLLAPIPYTPYRTQRADSITLRSSSAALLSEIPSILSRGSPSLEASLSSAAEKSLEAKYPPTGKFTERTLPIPVSVHPFTDSSPEYLPTISQDTENLHGFIPIKSESSVMPEPSSTQREVQLLGSVPVSASLPVYNSSTSKPCYDQADIPESLPVKIFSDIRTDNLSMSTCSDLTKNLQVIEPNNNQTEVPSPATPLDAQLSISNDLLPHSSVVPMPIPTKSVSELQPHNVQADLSPRGSLPVSLAPCTKSPSESQIIDKGSHITLQSHVSPYLPTGSLTESQSNIIQSNFPIQKSSSSSTIPTEIPDELIQADIFLPKPLPIPQSLPTEVYAGPQLNNIQADIPLVEPSREFPSITTERSSGSLLNVEADISFTESSSEPPCITLKGSSESQLNDTQGDSPLVEPPPISSSISHENSTKPLVEPSHEPPSITTETSPGPKLNAQANTLLIDSSSESPPITTEGSSVPELKSIQASIPLPELLSGSFLGPGKLTEPQLMNIQADSLPEPPSLITEGWSGPHLNIVTGDIPFIEPPSISSSLLRETSGPQINGTQAEPLPKPPPITAEGWSAPQLNIVPEDISFIEPPLVSSSILREGSSGLQVNGTQAKSLPEPSSITAEGLLGPHLNIVLGDISFTEPPLVSSSLLREDSSGPQLNGTQAEALPEPPPITAEGWSEPQLNVVPGDIPFIEPPWICSSLFTESSSGPQSANTQAVALPDPLPITAEGPTKDQPNFQADFPLIEPLSISPPLLTENSAGAQSSNTQAEPLPEPPSFTTESSIGPNNTQADVALLESLTCLSPPTKSSAESQLSNDQEGIQKTSFIGASHESSGEPQVNNIQGLLLFHSTESSTGPQPEHFQPIALSLESSPVSLTPESRSLPEPFPNRLLAGTFLTGSTSASLSSPAESASESQPNDIQTNTQSEELLPIPLSLNTDGFSTSQPSDNQTNMQSEELLTIPSCLTTNSSFESQPNDIQTDIQSAELLLMSSSLAPEDSSESQTNDIQSDTYLAEILPVSSFLPTEHSSQSLPNNIQSDIQKVELLPAASSIPAESLSELNLDDIHVDILSSLVTQWSTESQLVQADIPLLELSLTSSVIPTMHSSELQSNGSKSDGEPLESTSASLVPSREFHANDDQRYNVDQESLSGPIPVPINGSSELQLNNMEADILQEPLPAPPTEARRDDTQTDLLLLGSSSIEVSSHITTNTGPLPHQAQKGISLIETSPVSSSPSIDSLPSSSIDIDTQRISFSTKMSEEPPPITTQTEVPLTEPSSAYTSLPESTLYYSGKPNEDLADKICPLPIPFLEDAFPDQCFPSPLTSDNSQEFPLASPSPPCETVFAEKVLVEDPHPGSPPVNGNFIALESVPTINRGEHEESICSDLFTVENIPGHGELSSYTIPVAEEPASAPNLVPDHDLLLNKQLNSNSSEALL
ncbi:uncharacterized protein [Dendropsophus ebraccatus]|uniref:uncharacterized protein isoform X2 n=1 Tax=Dendropsophus ebraccatus TaxID=150705 RepID=UPI0038321013